MTPRDVLYRGTSCHGIRRDAHHGLHHGIAISPAANEKIHGINSGTPGHTMYVLDTTRLLELPFAVEKNSKRELVTYISGFGFGAGGSRNSLRRSSIT